MENDTATRRDAVTGKVLVGRNRPHERMALCGTQ